MNFTFADRLRYRFDNLMSRGPIALIGWLFLLSAVLILVVSLVVFVSGIGPTAEDGSRLSFLELAWMSLMRTLDAGTMGGDTGSWPFLLAMFVITMGGIFVVSILIGILTSGIESRLDELRKGRSLVVETGHTVILGWSPQVFTIVSELVIANENQPNACIVILADRDKVEMEDEIRSQVGSPGGRGSSAAQGTRWNSRTWRLSTRAARARSLSCRRKGLTATCTRSRRSWP